MKLSKGLRKHVGERNPSFFVCHWDVCLSSKMCHRVLKQRGISVHFAIDNDGTIYQFMDMNDVAYHAGGKLGTTSPSVWRSPTHITQSIKLGIRKTLEKSVQSLTTLLFMEENLIRSRDFTHSRSKP